jgi:hypothetical protein
MLAVWICCKRVNAPDLMKRGKKKKSYAKVVKICGKNESSSPKTVKKKREMHTSFAVIYRNQKLWPQYMVSDQLRWKRH